MDLEQNPPRIGKKIHNNLFLRQFFVFFCCLLLTSCMVGPNFHSPRPPYVFSYTEKPVPVKTVGVKMAGKGGKPQTLYYGRDFPAEWWHFFHSKQINHLIGIGLVNSPTLAAAKSALCQAQETLNAQIGSTLFPSLNSQLSVERQRFPGSSIGNTGSRIFNVFTANLNMSYTLDMFGGLRRAIEAQGAQVDFQQFEVIAAYLTLTSNIVITSIQMASYQAQLKAMRQLFEFENNQLKILRAQFRLGGIAETSVMTQEVLVNQTRSSIPQLEKNLSKSRHALAVLIGVFPNAEIPAIDLDKLTLPTDLPVSCPSFLVRQRPDVRASEALLHAASAQIGVATANLFPQLVITGSYGWSALVPNELFSTISKAWSIAGTLTQPIFQGGALLAQRRAAIAAYNQALANYKQTVLQSFQDVADTLRALETDARTLASQERAENAARRALMITQEQYKLGGATYLTLLIAQQQYQQTAINRIQAQAARYTDTAALFQALGGGWWHEIWCMHQDLECT